jgi:hypothetical protein
MATIRITSAMPALPAAPPPIFTLPSPRVTERALLRLAGAFGLRASGRDGRIARDATTFTYAEGAYDLTLHRASGAFRFADRTRWQVDHRSNAELPDEEAAELARAHLRQYDLLPGEARALRVSRLNVATAGPDRVVQDRRVIDVAVCLQPVIRGLPVDGPGGKLTVYFDHERKATCVDHLSRRVGAIYREVTQLYPPGHALDAARRLWTRRGIAEVEVSEVRFCYYESGWNDRQRYLQPAYIVIATLFGPDRRIRTGNIYVSPAAVNHVGRIAPAAPPRRIAQEPRREQGGDSPPGRAR